MGEVVEFKYKELAAMLGVKETELRLEARSHKYVFLVPTIRRGEQVRPKIKQRVGYVAYYLPNKRWALVFTNSKYLAERKYAIRVKLI